MFPAWLAKFSHPVAQHHFRDSSGRGDRQHRPFVAVEDRVAALGIVLQRHRNRSMGRQRDRYGSADRKSRALLERPVPVKAGKNVERRRVAEVPTAIRALRRRQAWRRQAEKRCRSQSSDHLSFSFSRRAGRAPIAYRRHSTGRTARGTACKTLFAWFRT